MRNYLRLRRSGFFGGRHQFAGGLSEAAIAVFPFAHCALLFAAIEFAERRAFGDRLNDLVAKPVPGFGNRVGDFPPVISHLVRLPPAMKRED